jgi:anti-sigma factor RsiW
MKCTDVQQRIKAYLDNELIGRDAEAVSVHIKHCFSCSKEAALLSMIQMSGRETVTLNSFLF